MFAIIGDDYELLEHEQIKWVNEEQFNKYTFAPADIYFVEKLLIAKKVILFIYYSYRKQ